MTLSSPEPRPVTLADDSPRTDPRRDPAMRSLYRMSQTAGVGLQDYAAVNVFAVTGALIALASVLALIFADVGALLIIPAAAVVLSTLAFIQIQRSNGTQTGRLIAVAGIVIACALGGANVYGRISTAAQQAKDAVALGGLVKQLETASLGGKPGDVYPMFDSRFQEMVKPETFNRTIAARVDKAFGAGAKVVGIALGDRLQFEVDANGNSMATGLLILSADAKNADGLNYRVEEPAQFRKVDDQWKFHNILNWFDLQKVETASPHSAAPAQ